MTVLGSDWDFDTHWVSDVGTLDGRLLEWTLPEKQSHPVGFTLNLVDVKKERKVVCCVKIEEYSKGHIQIPSGVIKDQKGLDEMVVVAVSTLQRMRVKIKNEGTGTGTRAVGPEVAGKVDMDFAKNSFKADWQTASVAGGGAGDVSYNMV